MDGRPAPAVVLWRKHLALLVYLACSPDRTRSRDHLLGLLWPESSEAHARHSLNEAIRRLRSALGAERLVTRGDRVTLSGDGLVVRTAAPRGEFLDGLSVPDAPAFDEWLEHERHRRAEQTAAQSLAAGAAALDAGRTDEAIRAAHAVLERDALDEAAVRLLMRAAALRGEPAAALRAFHDFTTALAALNEHPGRELAALAERIRLGRWGTGRPAGPGTVPEPPIVGRAEATRRITAVLDEVLAGDPRVLLIDGEPGSGRTRALAEACARLALDGGHVVATRPLEADQGAAWSTLRLLMYAGLAGAPGAVATDPGALAVLAALAPRDDGEVALALAALLAAEAEEGPVAIAVDDAHLADGHSIGALRAALERLPATHPRPVAVVLTGPLRDADAPAALLGLRREVGRGLRGAAVTLAPLDTVALGELVAALAPWCPAGEPAERLVRRVMFETAGNPFLAVTLLRGLEESERLRDAALAWPPPGETFASPLPGGVPRLVRAAVVARVAALGAETAAVLAAASAAPEALEPTLLAAMCDRPLADLEAPLGELERAQFLEWDGTRYRFRSPLLADVVRQEFLTPGRLQRLSRRATELASGADRRT